MGNIRCEVQNAVTSYGVPLFSPLIQSVLAPSNYHKDHEQYEKYLENSLSLPYLNNEKDHPKAKEYKRRFSNLNFVLLVRNQRENIIFPRESSWFGEMRSDKSVVPMEQTKLYTHDMIGLKQLNEEGRISKVMVGGTHLNWKPDEVLDLIIPSL